MDGKDLPQGKLSPELLASLLPSNSGNPDVRTGAAVGEDAAVVRGHESLVVTADPVTLAGEEIGLYAVAVNSNDVVAMGGDPRYLTTTILFPPGTAESAVVSLFDGIRSAAREAGVLWIGGHTEVTSAVRRTVVSAQVVGFLDGEPTRTSDARPGHRVIMTKWAGLEGSTLIAREHPAAARRLLGSAGLREVLGWLRAPGITIRPEGRLLRGIALGAAHDPTEGGIGAACREIAERSQVGLRIHGDRIPVRRETRLLCGEWSLDPLGLLSSGVLLFTAERRTAETALRRLEEAGIPAADIGSVTEPERGIRLVSDGTALPMPRFAQDELLKIP